MVIKVRALIKKFFPWIVELREKHRYNMIKDNYIVFLKKEYKKNIKKTLNLSAPMTLNEKLQWLKVYYRDPIMTQCADKYGVREIVEKSIGKEYLIELYGVYENVEQIDFERLPNQFVLKPTHSSGRVIICKDKSKLDIKSTKKKLKKWLKENYYYHNGEWVYKDIKPQIICEKLLEGDIIDYKFMCFNGVCKLLFTCSERDRGLKVTFFDLEFNKLPFIRKYPSSNTIINKPRNFEEMIELSNILAKEFPFVRVDFYENNNKIYFGELTFFPGNGLEAFEPQEWDYKLGAMLDLDKCDKNYVVEG